MEQLERSRMSQATHTCPFLSLRRWKNPEIGFSTGKNAFRSPDPVEEKKPPADTRIFSTSLFSPNVITRKSEFSSLVLFFRTFSVEKRTNFVLFLLSASVTWDGKAQRETLCLCWARGKNSANGVMLSFRLMVSTRKSGFVGCWCSSFSFTSCFVPLHWCLLLSPSRKFCQGRESSCLYVYFTHIQVPQDPSTDET